MGPAVSSVHVAGSLSWGRPARTPTTNDAAITANRTRKISFPSRHGEWLPCAVGGPGRLVGINDEHRELAGLVQREAGPMPSGARTS